ncbi:MAG: hypothetical protein ACYC27_19460 [Armatimonadota bacterium]
MRNRFLALFVVSAVLLSISALCAEPRFRIIDLGVLGGSESAAYKINNKGQIIGAAKASSGFYHSVLWSNGEMTDLSPLLELDPDKWANREYLYSGVTAINEAGATAGRRHLDDGVLQSFLWNELGVFGLNDIPSNSIPFDLNNNEQVVGAFFADNRTQSYIWENGKTTLIGSDSRGDTTATAVNSLGQVTGIYSFSRPHPTIQGLFEGGQHAFVWESGSMTDLGSINGSSWGFDINDLGQVAGQSQILKNGNSGPLHAALWDDGEIVDLGALFETPDEWSLALAINNHCEIVGISAIDRIPMKDPPGSYSSVFCGFYWEDDQLYDLNDLIDHPEKWFIKTPSDINDNGVIVGVGKYTENGVVWIENRAFMLVPIEDKNVEQEAAFESQHYNSPE